MTTTLPRSSTPGRAAPRHGSYRLARATAAIALLTVGAVHLEQYAVAHYSAIPTIGSLFLANFIAATAFGVCLLARSGAISPRLRRLVDAAASLGGLGVAAGALAALVISERTPLFGFMEHGYRVEIVIAVAVETIAIVALGTLLAQLWQQR
jgi:hypothetical protein